MKILLKLYFYLEIPEKYRTYPGLCRNDDGKFNELGSGKFDPKFPSSGIRECKNMCNSIRECGAFSWDGSNCFLTSSVASYSKSSNWECHYSNCTLNPVNVCKYACNSLSISSVRNYLMA